MLLFSLISSWVILANKLWSEKTYYCIFTFVSSYFLTEYICYSSTLTSINVAQSINLLGMFWRIWNISIGSCMLLIFSLFMWMIVKATWSKTLYPSLYNTTEISNLHIFFHQGYNLHKKAIPDTKHSLIKRLEMSC